MKKIFIILCCFGILSAHATEMCARDDTVVISLDATVSPTKGIFNSNIEGLVGMNFSYGTLVYATGCFSINEIRKIQGDESLKTQPDILETSDEDLIGNSGWYNGDESNPDNERIYCYHQLIHPMLSKWVRPVVSAKFNNELACYMQCTPGIYNDGVKYLQTRQMMYDTIGR
jgi:hypothetical protein